jgi:putative tryptophan/tyrosine transport system substrate-binding protein
MQFDRLKRREFVMLIGGMAVAWPLAAYAQEAGRTYRIGGLAAAPRTDERYVALFDELHRAGFAEGRNLVVAGWESRPEQFGERAAELVRAKVDALFCGGGNPAIRAAQQASATIPIVGLTDDMVGSGLVRSLAHPGGNTTGVSILASELDPKRLQILHEFFPSAQRIAVLADPTTISTREQLATAAHGIGVDLVWFEASSPDEIARAIDALALARVQALNVLASPILFANRRLIIDRVAGLQLPAIYQWPEMAEEGALLAYGPRNMQILREIVAKLLIKVLHGTKPAEIPVEQPTKFELVINLKTAKAAGFTIPEALALRASKVIE